VAKLRSITGGPFDRPKTSFQRGWGQPAGRMSWFEAAFTSNHSGATRHIRAARCVVSAGNMAQLKAAITKERNATQRKTTHDAARHRIRCERSASDRRQRDRGVCAPLSSPDVTSTAVMTTSSYKFALVGDTGPEWRPASRLAIGNISAVSPVWLTAKSWRVRWTTPDDHNIHHINNLGAWISH